MELQIGLGPIKSKELGIKLCLTITLGWGSKTVGSPCVKFQSEAVCG